MPWTSRSTKMGEEKFGTQESLDILIEWDVVKPVHVLVFRPTESRWYRRLAPLRKYPGRMARVHRDIRTAKQANSKVENIRRSLRSHDAREDWLISRAKDDDGTYGVWVAYRGRLSDEEFAEQEKLRAYRSDALKKIKRTAAIKRQEQAARDRVSTSLRPPVWEDE